MIAYVGFRVNNDADRIRESHMAVVSHELFTVEGKPVVGGVYDLRGGTTDHNFLCTTCVHGKKLCTGHRGHLVMRVGLLQAIGISEVRRWLRIVCLKCGTLLVEKERFAHLPPGRRLSEAATAPTEGKRCRTCGAIHPRIVKDTEDYFTLLAAPPLPAGKSAGKARSGEKVGEKLYPDAMRTVFDRITNATVEAFGRSEDSHPSNLVMRILAFPPPTIRPGVRSFGGSSSSYHDSTNLLQHIVKRNLQLPERLPEAMTTIGSGTKVDGELDRSMQNLQQIHYDLVMGSSSTSVTQGNKGRRGLVLGARAPHSLLRNLPRKEGRIRANLLGKRVFYISRSTISGNTRFRIDEVGVPLEFARTLQVKEVVQEYNRDWLMTFFLNGRRQYPGCSHIVRHATGEVHDVAGLRNSYLEIGDELYRDVVNGDIAMFNRAPTLERSSIGAHKVIVIQDPGVHTFQMNVCACEFYNADFDGDQMNLWVTRNPSARAEAAIMSSVDNWFISTKTSGPVNGQVQDSTVGAYELTRSSVRIDKYHAMGLFAGAGIDPPRFDKWPADHIFTGRDIVSMLFETTPINYSRPPSSYSDVYAPFIAYDPSETLTVMEQGRLVRGVLDKRSVGAKASGGFFHLISREYGSQRALDMIYALQQITLQFQLWNGFTVSTANLLPSPEALEQIRASINSTLLEAQIITDRLVRGEIVPPIDSTVHEFYEQLQINALKINESEILRWILGSVSPESNGFFRMIAVGSKGSNPNLIHVSGAIGQTTINGERIREQFAFKRTLPYFPRFCTDAAARGNVTGSYVTGMNLTGFEFQDMNGRYDLINKALTTASTGYFMRKGIMNNQSCIVDNLRRVTKDTRLVQLLYGEDGLDSRELEKVSFRTVFMSDAALREAAWFDVGAATGSADAAAQENVDKAFAEIVADRDTFRRVFQRVEAANFGLNFAADLSMPVNVARTVESVFIAAKASGAPPVVASAAGLSARVERVRELCVCLPYTLINEIQERRRSRVPLHISAATSLMCMLVRAELNPRILARLTDEALEYIIGAIRTRYSLSLVDYGTAVGILAAQAISEPLTQYMLDSHHRSVAGGTNKSGLVRVAEIYGARSVAEEQSSMMQLPLKASVLGAPAGSSVVAQEIANSIEYVTLLRFTKLHDMLLEPYNALIYPPAAGDRAWINEFERSHPLIRPPGDLTNWCFRFVLDKSALVLKAVSLELIVRRLRARHPGLLVVHTPETVPEIVVRVWLRASLFKRGGDDEERANKILAEVFDTPIRGISGIMRAAATRITRHRVASDGALVKEDKWAITTTGTNLYGAMLHSAVDSAEVISNSVGDSMKLFGIEAARAKVISETRSFMEDNTPNLRHLYLYADEMTRTGRVTSVERGGLNSREHNNVLLRAGYGAPIQVFTDAALSATKTKVYGIAAYQLLGSTPQIGTFYNSAEVDEAFVRENTKSVDSALDDL
jgi:DNA-directed RNA polymerase beta' subunit